MTPGPWASVEARAMIMWIGAQAVEFVVEFCAWIVGRRAKRERGRRDRIVSRIGRNLA